MATRRIFSDIGKSQILGDQKTKLTLAGLPKDFIRLASQTLVENSVDVVPHGRESIP
jgi:hypothetical protein